MQKKLTITLDETVYDALHKVIGRRRISRFIEEVVRPHLLAQGLEAAYQHMAQDETREAEALAWAEATMGDVSNEPRCGLGVNFDPSVGGEIRQQRPAVILSNDAANTYVSRVQVVPLTSNVGRLYPSEALVTLQGKQSKAIADQLTTVSKIRLLNRIGRLSTRRPPRHQGGTPTSRQGRFQAKRTPRAAKTQEPACASPRPMQQWLTAGVSEIMTRRPILLLLILLLVSASVATAECMGRSPRYVQLKIVSCASALETVRAKIAGKGYAPDERSHVEISASFVSIVEAFPLVDVEIIRWNVHGREYLFKGAVTPGDPQAPRQYMLIGTPLESCQTFYADKTGLFVVDEHLACCRDTVVPDSKEIVAQCLGGLPSAASFGLALENLEPLGIPLPQSSR